MSTSIEWVRGDDGSRGRSWNPVLGCSRADDSCNACYAMRFVHRGMSKNHRGLTIVRESGAHAGVDWNGAIKLVPERLDEPLRVRRPTRWFVNSLSDLFHHKIPDEYIATVFGVMALASWHTFIVLTKRPARSMEWFRFAVGQGLNGYVNDALRAHGITRVAFPTQRHGMVPDRAWPLTNVILGISAGRQATFDGRVPDLLSCPAAVHAVSLEPLLEPVDVSAHVERLGWVIAGAESGSGARPADREWFRMIKDRCVAARTPFFFKQDAVGGRKIPTPILDGRRWTDFPALPR